MSLPAILMRRPAARWIAVLLIGLSAGCSEREYSSGERPLRLADPPHAVATEALGPQSSAVLSRPRIVVLGDSLTAGLGLRPEQAYPALLQQRIDREGFNYTVVNAGVSGDTS